MDSISLSSAQLSCASLNLILNIVDILMMHSLSSEVSYEDVAGLLRSLNSICGTANCSSITSFRIGSILSQYAVLVRKDIYPGQNSIKSC